MPRECHIHANHSVLHLACTLAFLLLPGAQNHAGMAHQYSLYLVLRTWRLHPHQAVQGVDCRNIGRKDTQVRHRNCIDASRKVRCHHTRINVATTFISRTLLVQ